MGIQVITIKPDGSVHSLKAKRGGLDLRTFGKADINRATVIEFDSERQKHYIQWTNGRFGNSFWNLSDIRGHLETAGGAGDGLGAVDWKFRVGRDRWVRATTEERNRYGLAFFEDYEDAVLVEVAVIQALQTKGAIRI